MTLIIALILIFLLLFFRLTWISPAPGTGTPPPTATPSVTPPAPGTPPSSGTVTQVDGGYLTQLGIETAEHAHSLFYLLNSGDHE